MEEWKNIADFPNYQVSSFGNVKNVKTCKLMRLNTRCGYLKVSLVSKNSKKDHLVHRLVALEFLDNPENKTDVNHKDKNGLNNNLSNLEWMTRQENNIHRCKGTKITSNKKKPIFRIDSNTNKVLDKYNSDTTAVVSAVGEKDEMRLGGKYFKPYKDGKIDTGYKDAGYVYAAPAISNPISGTDVRNWLSKGSEADKKKNFMKAYPKFDEQIFKLIIRPLQ